VIAYIAGPYRAKNKLGIASNILKAYKVAMEYWRKGYTVITPHLNSAFMDGIIPDSNFLKRDLELLQFADVMVVLPGWERSKGTQKELWCARQMGIKVIWVENKKWT